MNERVREILNGAFLIRLSIIFIKRNRVKCRFGHGTIDYSGKASALASGRLLQSNYSKSLTTVTTYDLSMLTEGILSSIVRLRDKIQNRELKIIQRDITEPDEINVCGRTSRLQLSDVK